MKKILIAALIICSISTNAQVHFGAPFTDNMVVVQNRNNTIWGTAPTSERVRIVASWADKDTILATPDNYGRWQATITVPQADNKAHTIKANQTQISNIAIGEVWLCSGQSNMEWSADMGVKNSAAEIASAGNKNIRIMQIPKVASDVPQNWVNAQWELCSPETMRRASAVGYFFARDLNQTLDVPIGIISDAWGGTVIESWTPCQAILNNSALEGKLRDNSSPWWSGKPGVLYNSMIYPLVPMALSGVIWYQGESNCDSKDSHPEIYEQLMQTLIGEWRKDFNFELPFYFVQIAPHTYSSDDTFAATLRQQQLQVAQNTPKTGVVIINDLVDDVKNVHPTNKQDVAARLARYALAEVYEQPISNYKSPVIEGIRFDKNRAFLTFKNAESGLVIRGNNPVGLKIAGAAGEFFNAKAYVDDKNRLVVWSSKVKKPVKVSYCYDKATVGNIFSTTGLPVAPFFK